MTNGSWATCQAKKEELIFKASGFEILLCWGPVIQQTMGIINKGIRKIKLIVYVSQRGTLQVDK